MILTGSKRGPENKGDEHARCGNDEELSATQSFHEERGSHGQHKVVNGQTPVDGCLCDCLGNADAVED